MFYTRICMRRSWKPWAAAVLSAGLLELPFPLAGPMPPWRSIFAWFGLAPLLWALLSNPEANERHPLRRAFSMCCEYRPREPRCLRSHHPIPAPSGLQFVPTC